MSQLETNKQIIQDEINRIVKLTGYDNPEEYKVFVRHDVYGTAFGNRKTVFAEVFIGIPNNGKILNAERLELIETHTRLHFENKPNAEEKHKKKITKLLEKYADFGIKTVKMLDNRKWIEVDS